MDQENQPLTVHFQTSVRRDIQRHLTKTNRFILLAVSFQILIVAAVVMWHMGLLPLGEWLPAEMIKNTSIVPENKAVQHHYAGHSIPSVKNSYQTFHELKQGLVSRLDQDTTLVDANRLVYGIDISNWQGEINWRLLLHQQDSIQFVIVKATEGDHLVDPMFYRNWANIRQSDLVFGAYHYFDLKQDPLTQAKLFLRTTHLQSGDLSPVVDVESPCSGCDSLGVTPSQLHQNLKIFLAELENTLNVRPVIYSSESFFKTYLQSEFQHYPLWIAAYEGKVPGTLKSFAKMDPIHGSIWQFSDRGYVPGITGNVDLDVSTSASLNRLRIP